MKIKILFLLTILFSSCNCNNQEYSECIPVIGGKYHVQGIAYDNDKENLYLSFTTEFVKTDKNGRLLGSIEELNGHMGAMTFDPATRKVYASFEYKNDKIGVGISKRLGMDIPTRESTQIYIAEIDVDKVQQVKTPFDEAVILHKVDEPTAFYLDSVEVNGKVLPHRHGCSGIDAMTIAPDFGSRDNGKRYLYAGAGIFSDTTRTDNDYNILLQFELDEKLTPVKNYFVKTGNTSYGIQNMGWDAHTDKLILAVYAGRKSQYTNYDYFSIDMSQEPFLAPLDGVLYDTEAKEQVVYENGWFQKHGSCGFFPLGDGKYYIAHHSKGSDVCISNTYLYEFTGDWKSPLKMVMPALEAKYPSK